MKDVKELRLYTKGSRNKTNLPKAMQKCGTIVTQRYHKNQDKISMAEIWPWFERCWLTTKNNYEPWVIWDLSENKFNCKADNGL